MSLTRVQRWAFQGSVSPWKHRCFQVTLRHTRLVPILRGQDGVLPKFYRLELGLMASPTFKGGCKMQSSF